jgi:hypothetical protein
VALKGDFPAFELQLASLFLMATTRIFFDNSSLRAQGKALLSSGFFSCESNIQILAQKKRKFYNF